MRASPLLCAQSPGAPSPCPGLGSAVSSRGPCPGLWGRGVSSLRSCWPASASAHLEHLLRNLISRGTSEPRLDSSSSLLISVNQLPPTHRGRLKWGRQRSVLSPHLTACTYPCPALASTLFQNTLISQIPSSQTSSMTSHPEHCPVASHCPENKNPNPHGAHWSCWPLMLPTKLAQGLA